MRCATCGHAWHAKLPEDGDAPVAPEDTGLTREQVERLRRTAQENSKARAGPHAEFRAREHAKRKKTRSRVVTIAWVMSGVMFVALLGLAVLFRNEVAEAFPRSASIYRLVGLEVNRFGLTLENVQAKRSFDGTTPVLTVTGAAVNMSDEDRTAPELRVTLKDEAGNEVQTWTDKLAVPMLGPGERSEFTSRFEAPPVETYRLTVTFAYPESEGGGTGDESQVQATEAGAGESNVAQAEGGVPAGSDHAPAADHAGEAGDH